MTVFTEGRHPGEFLMSEANGWRSRGKAVIASGTGVFEPGTIVGIITASKKYTTSPNAEVEGVEGAEVAKGITLYGGDATSADVEVAIINLDAEVNAAKLVYDDSVNDDTKKATKRTQLAALGIIAR